MEDRKYEMSGHEQPCNSNVKGYSTVATPRTCRLWTVGKRRVLSSLIAGLNRPKTK